MRFPSSIQKLIELLSRLPSVGPKTAERYVFYLLEQQPAKLKELAQAIEALPEAIKTCSICFSYGEKDPCDLCADTNRDKNILCVVADSRDLMTIEDTKLYKGYYFVLGGTIDTIEGVTPHDIRIKELVDRIKEIKPREVILALNPNLEGETTSLYLAKILKPANIKVSRLAKGLPTGANIEYADELTLGHALKFRNEV